MATSTFNNTSSPLHPRLIMRGRSPLGIEKNKAISEKPAPFYLMRGLRPLGTLGIVNVKNSIYRIQVQHLFTFNDPVTLTVTVSPRNKHRNLRFLLSPKALGSRNMHHQSILHIDLLWLQLLIQLSLTF